MWLIPAFISAFLLGVYEISKKRALNGNAVIPVLFLNVLFCCTLFIPLIILSFCTDILQGTPFQLPAPEAGEQIHLAGKAILVLSSWISAYFALKHLPITLASPIKATQPLITLSAAVAIFGERLNAWQWAGVTVGLSSIFLLSLSGKKEGIRFQSDKWVWFMFMAVITGAASGLYDKYLIQIAHIDKMSIQVWYNFYQLAIMCAILMILWFPNRGRSAKFRWSWAIPLISIFLTMSDFAYFYALSLDGMISVVSLIRRSSVLVSFIGGALLFREHNLRTKAFDLFMILLAMILIYAGSH